MKQRVYENGEYTTIVEFKVCGYGINAQTVYNKVITVYSIARGIIKYKEVTPCGTFCRWN